MFSQLRTNVPCHACVLHTKLSHVDQRCGETFVLNIFSMPVYTGKMNTFIRTCHIHCHSRVFVHYTFSTIYCFYYCFVSNVYFYNDPFSQLLFIVQYDMNLITTCTKMALLLQSMALLIKFVEEQRCWA